MSDTPPHASLNGRDRTPELSSRREKRHRDDDEERDRDRDRSSGRRHRRDEDDGRDRDRERDRERDRDRDYDRERERRHRHRDRGDEDETPEEREERRRRRKEREREYDDRDPRELIPRDRDRDRERDRARLERDRSRESHRSHRSRDHGNGSVPPPPAIKEMSREEKEAERERRDREMAEERRGAPRHRDERYGSMDRDRERRRYDDRPPYSPPPPRGQYQGRRRDSPMYEPGPPPGPPPPQEPEVPKDPATLLAESIDMENRSVFVSQLASRLTSSDLGMFFEEMLGEGTIRDARIVTDRGSRRSKGIGYVELDNVGLINKAISLSGTVVMGIPIIVRLTEAERNHEGKTASQLAAEATKYLSAPANPRNHAPQQIHFPPLSTGLRLPPGLEPDAHKEASIPYHRLYVTNLAYNLTIDDLGAVFEPFGQIEFIDLHTDYTGQSKGTAYVQFRDLRAAQMALDAMHGFELAGRPIKVQTIEERSRGGEAVEDAGYQPRMDAKARQQLMQKLARTEPTPGAGSSQADQRAAPARTGPGNPTPFLVVSNMFNPEEETERNWDLDLAEDVKGEVERQYGRVRKIKVDKMSAGEVYVEFTDVDTAIRAQRGLGGRFFGGRQLGASFISETIFKAHL